MAIHITKKTIHLAEAETLELLFLEYISLLSFDLYFMCISVDWTTHAVPGAWRQQVLDVLLELEVQPAVNYQVGVGNRIQVFCNSSQCS